MPGVRLARAARWQAVDPTRAAHHVAGLHVHRMWHSLPRAGPTAAVAERHTLFYPHAIVVAQTRTRTAGVADMLGADGACLHPRGVPRSSGNRLPARPAASEAHAGGDRGRCRLG